MPRSWFMVAFTLALIGGLAVSLGGGRPGSTIQIVTLALLVPASVLVAYFEWRRRWRPYDPSWLAELARQQHPDKPWLAETLARCTRVRHESTAYFRFVSSRRANRRGSAWQFLENITLEHDTRGTLVLDILAGHRVGGVEFLSQLLGTRAA